MKYTETIVKIELRKKIQDQENIKNQEEQEKQPKEDNAAMTKFQYVFNLAHDQANPDKIDAVIRSKTLVS
ncbi:DUF389 domain-containing protein, partial [Neisseria sp. P0006.S009]